MWLLFPESSPHVDPSRRRSRGSRRKTSCHTAETKAPGNFTARARAMPEATALEGLFHAFGSRPGNYRIARHPAPLEHPVRCLREVGVSESIQFPERESRS